MSVHVCSQMCSQRAHIEDEGGARGTAYLHCNKHATTSYPPACSLRRPCPPATHSPMSAPVTLPSAAKALLAPLAGTDPPHPALLPPRATQRHRLAPAAAGPHLNLAVASNAAQHHPLGRRQQLQEQQVAAADKGLWELVPGRRRLLVLLLLLLGAVRPLLPLLVLVLPSGSVRRAVQRVVPVLQLLVLWLLLRGLDGAMCGDLNSWMPR